MKEVISNNELNRQGKIFWAERMDKLFGNIKDAIAPTLLANNLIIDGYNLCSNPVRPYPYIFIRKKGITHVFFTIPPLEILILRYFEEKKNELRVIVHNSDYRHIAVPMASLIENKLKDFEVTLETDYPIPITFLEKDGSV